MTTAFTLRFKWGIVLLSILLIQNLHGNKGSTKGLLIQRLNRSHGNSASFKGNTHKVEKGNHSFSVLKSKTPVASSTHNPLQFDSVIKQGITDKRSHMKHEDFSMMSRTPTVNTTALKIISNCIPPTPHCRNNGLKVNTAGRSMAQGVDQSSIRQMKIVDINDGKNAPFESLSSSKSREKGIFANGHDVNSNQIRSYEGNCTLNGTFCMCQNLNLTSVPSNLPRDIKSLDLKGNSITSLGLHHLRLYTSLQWLKLESNDITYLNKSFFLGLSNLTYLNLKNNYLAMNETNFPEDTFLPLESLRTLIINRCNHNITTSNLSYPDKALAHLPELKNLTMDGLKNKTFGGGFKKMTKLANLNLAGFLEGYCEMGLLRNDTFENLTQLRVLNISNCNIHGHLVEYGTFQPLQNLTHLSLYYNDNLGLETVSSLMWGLQNSSLIYLDIGSVVSRFSDAVRLNSTFLRYFPKSLETIIAIRNSIEAVDGDFFSKLPPNLTHVEVGDNKFVFQEYMKNFSNMQNLETLLVNGGSYLYELPYKFPKRSRRSNTVSSDFEIHIPKSLKRFEMQVNNLRNKLSQLKISGADSLKTINLFGNYLPILKGPFIGFDELQHFIISSSFVQEISKEFFQKFPRLKTLRLDSNLLRSFFLRNETVFQNLTNLEILDLTFNAIPGLNENVFEGLSNLRELHIGRNIFDNFSVRIDHMKNLHFLNLSDNLIHNLPKHITDHIDTLTPKNFTANLFGCPIQCTCQNLEFLHWMVKSKAFKSFKNYTCVYDDQSRKTMTNGYNETIVFLNKTCASMETFFWLVGVATVLVVALMAVAILYRFRWKLKYLYYAAYLWYNKKRSRENSDDFMFDVFISYASTDENFVLEKLEPELKSRGLKVYLHGRDFVTGEYIASNIFAAVRDCKKTLVVLTENLLNSHWCNYELQMANMESVYSGRQVLVFLIKEDISLFTLGKELLYHIRNNTYISYPTQEEVSQHPDACEKFWDKLAKDLK